MRTLPTGLVLGCNWCPFLVGCSAKLSLGGASPSQVSCWLAGSLGGAPPQETSASGLLPPWAPSREAGSLCYGGKSPGEPTALSVYPSVKWDCQTVCKLRGRSRPALSPGVDRENPFDPSPCISSTWPVTWEVVPECHLRVSGAASLVLRLVLLLELSKHSREL